MIAPCSNLDDEAEAVLHSEESIEERYLQKELISEVNRIIETLPEKNPNTADTVLSFKLFRRANINNH